MLKSLENIFQKIKSLSLSSWVAFLMTIALVAAIIISIKKQNRHERALILNREIETTRLRDSIKTAMRKERIDSLEYYRNEYYSLDSINRKLQLQLKSRNEKASIFLDSINRVIAPRPKY